MARAKATPRKTQDNRKTPAPTMGKQVAQKSAGGVAVKISLALVRPRGAKRAAPGSVALREIKKYSQSKGLLLRKTPFARVVKRIAQKHNADMKFQHSALKAIQQATESYLVGFFEDANLCALHAKRITVKMEDISLTRLLRNQICGRGRDTAKGDEENGQ